MNVEVNIYEGRVEVVKGLQSYWQQKKITILKVLLLNFKQKQNLHGRSCTQKKSFSPVKFIDGKLS